MTLCESREIIVDWIIRRARAVMDGKLLANRAALIAEVAQRFRVPRHVAENCVGHAELRLRRPR